MTENTQNTETKEIEQAPEVSQVETQEAAPEIKTEENQANWKKFREERERDRKALKEEQERSKRKEEEAQALKAALEAVTNKPVPQNNYDSYDDEESESDRIARLVRAEVERKEAEYDKKHQAKEQAELPKRLASEYKDFNEVCSTENLDYFEYNEPNLAKTFAQIPDSYDKWASIYKLVKKMVPQNKSEDNSRLERNLRKPQANSKSMADTNPEGSPHRMTEKQRVANWRRMQGDMRSFS